MRGNHNIDLLGEARPSVVLDVMHAEHLKALAASRVHGGARLARLLQREAARTAIVPAGAMPADAVGFGSEVTYRDEATGKHHTIVLATPEQADIRARRVSVLSPVGTPLIGRSEGAVVACEFPAGRMRRLAVLRVAADPSAARPAPPRAAARPPDAASRIHRALGGPAARPIHQHQE